MVETGILKRILADRARDLERLGPTFGYQVPSMRTRPLVPFLVVPGVILEIKRASPSKGVIAPELDPKELATSYSTAGARNISVLTEMNYFRGSLDDLMSAATACPHTAFLRKDFITSLEEVGISYRAGADALLLIARILDGQALCDMVAACFSYGLRPFVEVRSPAELRKLIPFNNDSRVLYGVNSRDLASFNIDPLIPAGMIGLLPGQAVYESGIHSPGAAAYAHSLGFEGILAGESVARDPLLASSLVAAFEAAQPDGNGRFWKSIATRLAGLHEGALAAGHTGVPAGRKRPLVKICGITCVEDGLAAAGLGADLLGFVFADSPRAASEETVREIRTAMEELTCLPPLLIGVITDLDSPRAQSAIRLARLGLLDALQYHSPAKPEILAALDKALDGCEAGRYLVVNAGSMADLDGLDVLLRNGQPRVLVDARVQGATGGTGRTVPEAVLDSAVERGGLWLAGGLGPGTVGGIMDRYRPELLDASSLLEAGKGRKDPAKLEAFFKEIAAHV